MSIVHGSWRHHGVGIERILHHKVVVLRSRILWHIHSCHLWHRSHGCHGRHIHLSHGIAFGHLHVVIHVVHFFIVFIALPGRGGVGVGHHEGWRHVADMLIAEVGVFHKHAMVDVRVVHVLANFLLAIFEKSGQHISGLLG